MKVIVLVMLFSTVISSGNGGKWVAWAVGWRCLRASMELFPVSRRLHHLGALSLSMNDDHAANHVSCHSRRGVLVVLLLFWTAIKADYRQIVAASDTQAVTASVFGAAAGRQGVADEIEWTASSVMLLWNRLYRFLWRRYRCRRTAPEGEFRTGEKLWARHAARFLFPNKGNSRRHRGLRSPHRRLGVRIGVLGLP